MNTETFQAIYFYFNSYLDHYAYLVPLGIIGIWRWSVWMMKEVVGLYYHPKTKEYNAKVSIVTPVYNENPKVFATALKSWSQNRPDEIIAVIDYTDLACIEVFKQFQNTFKKSVLIITKIPGKREALRDGIKIAKSEVVALVDSDTIWAQDVIRNGLPPFHDHRVAGVATYQSVLNPKTFAQKIFDIQLDLRYRHEYPFLAALGGALVCLSGRTAFYRRIVITPMLSDLVNETFMGKPVISGDDKRLTYLVLEAGWRVAYQSSSHVYTPGMESLASYLKQRLRWTRNGLRADIAAIWKGWPLRHPALLFFQIDKFLQSFVVILSPIYFFVSLYFQLWSAAAIILGWWSISRTVKIYHHLALRPSDIFIVPGYILYTFLTGIIKIYAFFTLNTQGWITRWDKSRLPQLKIINSLPAYCATITLILLLTYSVYLYKQHTYIVPRAKQQELLASTLKTIALANASDNKFVLGASTASDTAQMNLLTKRYQTRENETLTEIAKKFGVDRNQLLFANSVKMPNGYLAPETNLTIPGKDIKLEQDTKFTTPTKDNLLTIQYDTVTNTVLVRGRGKKVTLTNIAQAVGKEYLEEVNPKVWHAKATIYIYNGATLVLDKSEVEWLKLESNNEKFVTILSRNGDISINGLKITSWDNDKNDYDKDMNDGRSFIMARDSSRMDINSSELSYLGFPTNPNLKVSPYGVSWKMSKDNLKKVLLTGEVINSKFHHNYFGAYTFGATGMLWRGNEFYNNTRYGLDPHDDSNGFLVEGNIAHDNGAHGIIFSKRCINNVIRNNISYNNKGHGIMLHEESNNNIVENNTVDGNTSGIALWRSSNNIVRNNTVKNNRHGIRANVSSNNNVIEKNIISGSILYGVYVYDNANSNLIGDNILERNNVAMYVKSNSNNIQRNLLKNNNIGIYLKDKASANILANNQIKNSLVYGIYTKVETDFSNILGYNKLDKNLKNIVGKVNISDESEEESL